jgi:L-lactate dehydrogenase complex protein LldG
MVGSAMTAREEILARIRAALGPTPEPVPAAVVGPATTRDHPDVVALLTDRIEDYRATVRRCDAPELPAAIGAALAGANQVVAPDDVPEGWLSAYRGRVRRDTAGEPMSLADLDAAGMSVLTGCAVAIAGTGTIILDAGPHQGRRALTLVPDHHVCVVRADQIVHTVPAGLARLTDPARPITLISGPSATSDIELDRVEGVHGPRRLDVVIVDLDSGPTAQR